MLPSVFPLPMSFSSSSRLIARIRQILPLPVLNVSKVPHPDGGGDVLVVEVRPHDMPPVRYKGRVHIRVGPRKDTASETEERVLMERRTANFPTFDATPCPEGDLKRLDLETFRQTYRPAGGRGRGHRCKPSGHQGTTGSPAVLQSETRLSDQRRDVGIRL